MGVLAVPGIKCIGCALFGHHAVGQHHDFVRTGYGAHPVGDDKNGFVFYEPGKCLLNGSFVLHVQTGGGLVQQNDGRILQEGAGNGNALTLAAGKGAAILADVGVPLVRQLFGKFLAVCQLCRRKDSSSVAPLRPRRMFSRIVLSNRVTS